MPFFFWVFLRPGAMCSLCSGSSTGVIVLLLGDLAEDLWSVDNWEQRRRGGEAAMTAKVVQLTIASPETLHRGTDLLFTP